MRHLMFGAVLGVSLLVGSVVGCSLTIDEEALSGGDPGDGPGEGGDSGVLECTSSQKTCAVEGEDRCVGLDDPDFGCSRRNCTPCNLTKATPTCSPATGECVVAACVGSFEDCDGADSNGCEIDLNTDLENCGACGAECDAVPNADVACGGARCFIRVCEQGFGDCNEDFDDGCEVDLSTSAAHCGECGAPCDGTCVDGTCMPL